MDDMGQLSRVNRIELRELSKYRAANTEEA